MTTSKRVRIFMVGNNGQWFSESSHSEASLNGLSLRDAYDRIRNHPMNADLAIFHWELSVVE